MEMKHFYLSMALAGALTVQAVPVAKPYYGQVSEPGKSSVLLDRAAWRAPMRVTVDELFACPGNTVLDGPFKSEEVGYQGFQSSDQGRPGMPTKFYQAFHGCYNSVNAVRVIGLFNYFDDEEYTPGMAARQSRRSSRRLYNDRTCHLRGFFLHHGG